MTMAQPNWLQFTAQQTSKRKRAELACSICHSKKIKCDFQSRIGQGLEKCTNCDTGGRDCRIRESKRDRGRRVRKDHGEMPFVPPDSAGDESHTFGQGKPREQSTWNRPQVQRQLSNYAASLHGLSQVAGKPVEPTPNVPSISPNASEWQPFRMPNMDVPAIINDSPATNNTGSFTENSYPVDAGFLRVYGPENQSNARDQEETQALTAQGRPDSLCLPPPDLQQGFADTYFEYCYTWCPVLDRDTLAGDMLQSPMLVNALALVGSHVQPPMLPHDGPAIYYDRARRKFYEDEEPDVMLLLKAVSLFYWWSPRPPTTVHRHSSWWWQSVIIRHCQHIGVHREPAPGHPSRTEIDFSLRRRVWWTAFARERLTAICQSRPVIIDPEDCNIGEPTMDDFPGLLPHESIKAEIFIHWVRLCAIIGRVAKYLYRTFDLPSAPFPDDLAHELIKWVTSLPPYLQLPIGSNRTTTYSRDVHQLHLPYLTVIIVLHLKRSRQPLPEAYPPAMMAATCIARILKDILARGGTRYMMGISCWYTGSAFTALLQACRSEHLAVAANQDLDICSLAIDQLRKMWPTGNIMYGAFQRLRQNGAHVNNHSAPQLQGALDDTPPIETGIEWISYFPFASSKTSELAGKLLTEQNQTAELFPNSAFADATMYNFPDLFEPDDMFSEMNFCMQL